MFDKLWEFLAASLEALLPWFVVQPYQRALQIRLGKFVRELGPGFHWIIPLHIDYILHENVNTRVEKIEGLITTTADGKSIGFDAIVTYRISNMKKALLEIEGLRDAITDSCAGTIGTALTELSWADIWHTKVWDTLTASCRKKGWRWGVEIEAVQLTGVAIVKNLRLSINSTPHHGNVAHINFPGS